MSRSVVGILVQVKQTGLTALNRVKTGLASLKAAIFSVQTAVAGLVAFVAVHVGAKLVGAWAKQEQAVASLNAVLVRTNRYTKETGEGLQKAAAEIQKLTTFADEDLLKATAVLGKFADELSPEQLGQAMKTVVGLSSALGLDLASAALTLGKSLSGEINLLARFGITLDTTKGQSDKFNEAFGKTIGFFNDAVAETQTLAGQFTQASNALGDFKETIGQTITEIFGLTKKSGSLRDKIVSIDGSLKENMDVWVRWGRVVGTLIFAVAQTVIGLIRLLFNSGQVIGDVFAVAITGLITGIVAAADQGIAAINWLIRQANRIPGIAIGELTRLPLRYFVDQTKGYAQDLADNADDIRGTFSGVARAWIATKNAIDDNPIIAEIKAPIAGGAGLEEVGDAAEAAEKAIGDAQTRLALLNAQLDAGTISRGGYRAALDDISAGLNMLADAGAGSDENLTKVLVLLTQLKARRAALFPELAEQAIADAEKQITRLDAQFAAGTLHKEAYRAAIDDVVIGLDRLIDVGAGSAASLAKVLALRARLQAQRASLFPEQALADATAQLALLNAQLDAGTIHGDAYRTAIDGIIVGLEALAAAGAGSAENLTQVLNLLSQMKASRAELFPAPPRAGARPPGPELEAPAPARPAPFGEALPVPQEPSGLPPWADASVFEKVRQQLVLMGEAAGALDIVIADMTSRTFVAFGEAITEAFAAMIDGSQAAGAAFAAAMLGALAAVAKGFGEFFLAQATASLASFFGPTPNKGGLIAAAKWAAAASAMFALSGALSAASAGVGGGGGAGAGAPTADNGPGDAEGIRDTVNVYIEGGLLNLNDPNQERAFVELLSDLSDRDVFVRTRRANTIFG